MKVTAHEGGHKHGKKDLSIILKVVVAQKSGLWKQSFYIIFRFEMILSDVYYERKKVFFYEKNLKLMKNITFKGVFYCDERKS